MIRTIFVSMVISVFAHAKEIALTFDDAPVSSSLHFTSEERTETLIRKLSDLKSPAVMVFANPCKREDSKSLLAQLKKYRDAGHLIGNHTCNHPRFDNVGFRAFSEDAKKADELLQSLFSGQKFFRFPFLNEGKNQKARNQMRTWLQENGYRNGYVSVDNDDTVLTAKLNEAKKLGKKIDYAAVEKLFVKHILTAANFYDDVAVKLWGRSPKHVLLLHEIDGTVLYIDTLIRELRKDGWNIVSVEEAYKDPLFNEEPKNTDSGNGLIAQMYFEKHGQSLEKGYYDWRKMTDDLNRLLGLEEKK